MRRNLLIARTLARPPVNANVLLVAGARELTLFPLEPGIDSLTLPALSKTSSGLYGSRRLELPLAELVSLRAEMIRTAIEQFRPDVFIADKAPRGILNELDPVLRHLEHRGETCCILGLRDILDEPERTRREWSASGSDEAVQAYYRAVWVYGDPAVYDSLAAYGFSPGVAARVRYTGYLESREAPAAAGVRSGAPRSSVPSGPIVLCQVGGGQDGGRLAHAFARAARPPGTRGVILTGPYMPERVRRRLKRSQATRPDLTVLEFEDRMEPLLDRSDRLVSMGGYNTLCEALAHGKPTLVVPRVRPRTEQLIRAERLQELGLVQMLHPDQATPDAISEWLSRDIPPPPPAREVIDFHGTRRIPALLTSLLNGAASRRAPEVGCVA